MHLLFSIGIQGALEEAAGTLEAGEQLCAFLDNIHVFVPAPQSEDDLRRVGAVSFQGGRHSPSPGHACGTRQVFHQMMSTFSGTRRGSLSSGRSGNPPLGTHSLLQRNSAPELRRSEGYGRRCPHCLICSGWQI